MCFPPHWTSVTLTLKRSGWMLTLCPAVSSRKAGTCSVSYSGLPSPQRLPYNRAQQVILEGVILEGRASLQPGIQGSLGPELVHGLLPVPLTQLPWVLGLSCIAQCIHPWTFFQATLNLIARSSIYLLQNIRPIHCASTDSIIPIYWWAFNEKKKL